MTTLRSRIAPTPSGYLHAGNACSFLLTAGIVQRAGGVLRLRIDDLDAPRAREAYISDIFDTLRWLGISWQEGPQDAESHMRDYSQQQRTNRYEDLIRRLTATGRVFACSCSRAEVMAHSADGQYPGTCRHRRIPLDTPGTSLRLMTPEDTPVGFGDFRQGHVETDLFRVMRDFVIRRRDCIPAYHIASLADDLDFDMNFVVRGADLLYSTAAQLYIAELLGISGFRAVRFLHHPLLTDDGGSKLSKSAGSRSLRAMREQGADPGIFRDVVDSWMAGLPEALFMSPGGEGAA